MVRFEEVSLAFDDKVIFDRLSFEIKKGEKVALTGESGSGKSTLLNLLPGFIPHFQGKIEVDGLALNPQNVHAIRKKTAYVPQELQFTVYPTVKALFFAPFGFTYNKSLKPDAKEIKRLFSQFDISPELLNRSVKEISGGQKQRILLAGALLLKRPLLLLDEPTSALNKEIKQTVTDYVLGLEGVTVIAATHDEYWMKKSDKVLNIKNLNA